MKICEENKTRCMFSDNKLSGVNESLLFKIPKRCNEKENTNNYFTSILN